MDKPSSKRNENVLLKGTFTKNNDQIIDKFGVITEFLAENEAYIYLGKKEEFTTDKLEQALASILKGANRSYQVDIKTFTTKTIDATAVAVAFVAVHESVKTKLWNLKTNQKDSKVEVTLYEKSKSVKDEAFNKALILAKQVTFARNLQIMSPNTLDSETLANKIVEATKELVNDKFSVKVLDKEQIEKHKMGLILSVNRGSMFEPRVVVLEYKGNPRSKNKTVYVGKGITFDSGGYNIKTGRNMVGMKFDMSGAAIVASSLMAIAQLNPKSNVAAVMMITDNRVNGDASIPDSVWVSMNGKSVEVNNTDAEGRLVLADGITYAIRNLKATRVIDVATLTGAVLVALGETYTGVWSTNDKAWIELENASKKSNELLWRMPFHDKFAQYIKKSQVADLKNTDFTGLGGSISAAMFLKEFSEDVEFIHCDVAGTANQSEIPTGVLVRTLTELAL